jgi:HNH endonuclease
METEKFMKKKFKNKISQAIVCKYNKLKLGFGAQINESMFALACRSLTVDGRPRPDGVTHKEWVYDNAGFINVYVEKNRHKIKKIGGAWQFVAGHGADSSKSDIAYKAPKAVVRQRQSTVVQKRKNIEAEYLASKEFLQSFEWRKLRMEALKKYGGTCQCCGASPATGAVLNVDHIKPRKTYPELALDLCNLQVLCHECNHGKGNWDHTDWRK